MHHLESSTRHRLRLATVQRYLLKTEEEKDQLSRTRAIALDIVAAGQGGEKLNHIEMFLGVVSDSELRELVSIYGFPVECREWCHSQFIDLKNAIKELA